MDNKMHSAEKCIVQDKMHSAEQNNTVKPLSTGHLLEQTKMSNRIMV